MVNDEFMTVAALSRVTGMSRHQIYANVAAGTLPSVKLNGLCLIPVYIADEFIRHLQPFRTVRGTWVKRYIGPPLQNFVRPAPPRMKRYAGAIPAEI